MIRRYTLAAWLIVALAAQQSEASIEPSSDTAKRSGVAPAPQLIIDGDDGAPHTDGAPVDDQDLDDEDDDKNDEQSDGHVDDGESDAANASTQPVDDHVHRFTADLDDKTLELKWLKDLASLGTISVGFTDSGRLINGEKLECDESCEVVVPQYGYGTHEMVQAVLRAAQAVKAAYPNSAPLRVNHIGRKDGGYLRPHKSHQSGRDVDLGFYYKNDANPGGIRGQRTKLIDLGRNWLMLKTLLTEADVQVVLVDKAVQKVLYEYALEQGEDPLWLDAVFRSGKEARVQHARRHRDHFHARMYSPRSQELGRRVQPLLAKRPEENVISYRIRGGDNLGKIARKHGCTVAMIQKANGMRNTFLRVGRTLRIPLRGPCTHCPVPPPVVVPPRCLPRVANSESQPANNPPSPSNANEAQGASTL